MPLGIYALIYCEIVCQSFDKPTFKISKLDTSEFYIICHKIQQSFIFQK